MKNNEPLAWSLLRERGASQLTPGFADRALRAAHEASPALDGACYLGVATATLSLLVGVILYSQNFRPQTERNLAGWQQIASATDDLGPTP